MEPKVNISLKILPFFNFNFETPKFNNIPEDSEVEVPWYTEPLTTNIERIEIRFLESDTYLVPKTTAGMN